MGTVAQVEMAGKPVVPLAKVAGRLAVWVEEGSVAVRAVGVVDLAVFVGWVAVTVVVVMEVVWAVATGVPLG